MRKTTRLQNYNYKNNGYYFVTICTAMRYPYLEKYKDEAEKILNSLPARFSGLVIDYYVFMPDHLHVIFGFKDVNSTLSQIIRTYKALVTKKISIKPFWEWNYFEHIIREETALYKIRKYIEENPIEEKIDIEKFYSRINPTATKE